MFLIRRIFRLGGFHSGREYPAKQDLQFWRERILFAMVSTGVLLSALAFVPGIFLALEQGLWALLVLNTGALICGLALLVFRRVAYPLRAWGALGLVFMVGLYVVCFMGLLSGGPIWLFTFGIMCGLLLGLKAAVAGVWINAVTLAVLGWLHYSGHFGQESLFIIDPLRAVAAGGNFVLLNMVAAVSCALLIRALQALAEEEQAVARSLEIEKLHLMQAKERLENEISSRKEVERLLRDSEKRYRQLAENVSDVIWTFSLDTLRFSYVSPSVLRARGFTSDEAIALSLEQTLTPQSVETVTQALSEELARDEQEGVDPDRSRTMEIQQIFKDGSHGWAEATMSFIRNEEGKPVAILGITRDIRERKSAEEEKRRLEERLTEARKMEAIATLAGGLAHQFNNALNVITLSLDGIETEFPPNQEPSQFITGMKTSVERMTHLTEQLLAYARGGKYQSKEIPVADLMKASLSLVRHTIKSSVHLIQDFPESLWTIEADVTQVQMALSAILSNASEAIEGQGSIRVTCRNFEVKGSEGAIRESPKAGRYVCLTVQDDGKGMDEETQRKIFEPFYTTKFQGRGLGMSAVYGIVKNHGGFISVDSVPGRGTSVCMYFPALENRSPRELEAADFEPEPKTVLLVEDEAMLMELLRTALEHSGYAVLEAASGREAVGKAGAYAGCIHAAVLDMVLPDLDIKELFHSLTEIRPALKVLLMSGYSIEGPAQELLDAGAEAFLQKPFAIETLLEKLRELERRVTATHSRP